MDYIIRSLRKSDADKGYLKVLSVLTDTPQIEPVKWNYIIDEVSNNPDLTILVAIDNDNGKIIGCATLLCEQKIIHGGASIGHIEDVVTVSEYQHKGIASSLIKALIERAKERKCYKVILSCDKDTIPFYERLGFRTNETEMRIDL